MDNNQLNLNIKNIRAIKNADIILDGITVITGENGCGKSTISKLAYHLVKTSVGYDEIVDRETQEELSYMLGRLDAVTSEVTHFAANLSANLPFKMRRSIQEKSQANETIGRFDEPKNIDYLIQFLKTIPTDKFSSFDLQRLNRIRRILVDRLSPETNSKDANVIELLEDFRERMNDSVKKAEFIKKERPLFILENSLSNIFHDRLLSKSYSLQEYGVAINDRKNKKVNQLYSIHNVAYIDTPMILGLDIDDDQEREHWEDLNHLLKEKSLYKKNKTIDSVFKNDIIKGDIQEKSDNLFDDSFVYERKDGKEFNLLECATGLKSFAILQLLYKNGFLNDTTLLIIDEPEAHLHPQWVVEYARLIILLNKHLGVKFLIASHHPDMISAIKYIAEKEKTASSLNYYLAKQIGETFLYNYHHLGNQIDEIFLSFNIALERIDLYGKTE